MKSLLVLNKNDRWEESELRHNPSSLSLPSDPYVAIILYRKRSLSMMQFPWSSCWVWYWSLRVKLNLGLIAYLSHCWIWLCCFTIPLENCSSAGYHQRWWLWLFDFVYSTCRCCTCMESVCLLCSSVVIPSWKSLAWATRLNKLLECVCVGWDTKWVLSLIFGILFS